MENEKTAKFVDHEGIRYWYEYRLAQDRVDICLATTDPNEYCNGTYLYSTKDPGNGMAFVVIRTEPVDDAFKKEQFELQQSVQYWAGRLIGHEQAYDIAKEIIEAIAYAAQQTASLQSELSALKEENEKLSNQVRSANADARDERARAIGLMEDVDRLTEIIKNQALSKESNKE
jgi:predicted RNase H-like nuclease (RuvC/YqgF family)